MALLTRERTEKYGPFVDFLEIHDGMVSRQIFSLADGLLETYCAVTNTYLPFDSHLGGEFMGYEINILARDIFMWSAHISQCRLDANDIEILADIYFPAEPVEHQEYEKILKNIREDLTETAAFLAMELLRTSCRENVVRINGL